jgi:hypothetical protein
MLHHAQQIRLLNQALTNPIQNQINILSPELRNMFVDQSADPNGNFIPAGERLMVAATIYNGIINAQQQLPFGVFYRKEHFGGVLGRINEQWFQIRIQLQQHLENPFNNFNGQHIRNIILAFFEQESIILNALNPRNEAQETRLRLYQLYLNNPDQILEDPLLENPHLQIGIQNWFNSQEGDYLITQNENIFYNVEDIDQARQEGMVYHPWTKNEDGEDEENVHNWGLNCAWVLGLIRRRINIRFATPITAEHRLRENPPHHIPGPHPSAFALEIAIALTAGYMLNYNNATNEVRLVSPPQNVDLIPEDNINGIEGQLLLQTRVNQLLLYDHVTAYLNHARLHNQNIENWVPTPLILQASQARLLAYTRNPNITLNTLIYIVNNHNANAAVLNSVRNHGSFQFDMHLLTAIARNPNVHIDLLDEIIMHANNNMDVLAAVARNLHVSLNQLIHLACLSQTSFHLLHEVLNAIANHPDTDIHNNFHSILEEIVNRAENIPNLQSFANSSNGSNNSNVRTGKEILRLLILQREDDRRNPFLSI